MITRRTVLVLGAGASEPYGFPLGGQLTDLLINQLIEHAGPSLSHDLSRHRDVEPQEVVEMLRTFSRSGLGSIDAFLGRREEYARVGKLAIAWALCQCENSAVMYRRGNEDHWLSALWDALTAGAHSPGDFSKNELRILTFNYDRSVEYFLHQSAKNTYSLRDPQASEVAGKVDVLHVYGKLGDLSFDGTKGRIYDPDLTAKVLDVAANGILIVPEARDDAKEFQLARTWFDWAEQICFLGFGFDPLNVRRLGLVDVLREKQKQLGTIPIVWASVYGKTAAEIDWIRAALCDPIPHVFKPVQHKNVLALRNTQVLL